MQSNIRNINLRRSIIVKVFLFVKYIQEDINYHTLRDNVVKNYLYLKG